MSISTNDAVKRTAGDKVRNTDREGREVYLPIVNDWVVMNPDYFEFVTATRINTPDFDSDSKFQVGDKLHIFQAGTDKWFNIIDTDTDGFSISAGSDYTLTSAAIEVIELSKATSPEGFPSAFNYTPTLNYLASTGWVTAVTAVNTATFYMVGNRVFVQGVLNFTFATGGGIIYFGLPFNKSGLGNGGGGLYTLINIARHFAASITGLVYAFTDTEVQFGRQDGAAFDNSDNTINYQFSL